MHIALLVVLAAVSSKPQKVLVLQPEAGEGVTAGTAKAIGAAATGEVRKRGLSALTPDDVQAMLGVERQKQLLGCSESNCLAEIGGALGAQFIVTSSVAKLGESWLVHLRLLDAEKAQVVRESDRRIKKGNIDDVLDALPQMVSELFGAAQPQQAPIALNTNENGSAPKQSSATPSAVKLPPNGVDEPAKLKPEQRSKLQVATDGQGHPIAFLAFQGFDSLLFAGDAHAMYAQRVAGGGSEGTVAFDMSFWEPRVRAGAESEFSLRDGKYTLTCKKQQIPYTLLDAKSAKAFLEKAKLDAPRWRRQVLALARDDEGTYYLADAPRAADDSDSDDPNADVHLYLGKKGALAPVKVVDVQRAGGKLLVQTDAGTAEFPLGDVTDKTPAGAWKSNGQTRALTPLDLWQNRGMIYTSLGAYSEPLGTACDPYLAK
jgi:hypothetical protein